MQYRLSRMKEEHSIIRQLGKNSKTDIAMNRMSVALYILFNSTIAHLSGCFPRIIVYSQNGNSRSLDRAPDIFAIICYCQIQGEA